MFILERRHFNDILNHSIKGLQNESCGLLGGIVDGDKKNCSKGLSLKKY